MVYTDIRRILEDNRKSTSAQDADDARTYFAGNLDHPGANGIFRYRKSGKSFLMSDSRRIAKIWRELLESDDEVRARWTAMQSQTRSQESGGSREEGDAESREGGRQGGSAD